MLEKIVKKLGDDKLNTKLININKVDAKSFATSILETYEKQIKERESKRFMTILKEHTVSKIMFKGYILL